MLHKSTIYANDSTTEISMTLLLFFQCPTRVSDVIVAELVSRELSDVIVGMPLHVSMRVYMKNMVRMSLGIEGQGV